MASIHVVHVVIQQGPGDDDDDNDGDDDDNDYV